jgi:pyrroline-5-carboxylate reductase
MDNVKVAIIGCGNLGLSIVHGLLAQRSVAPENITATRRNLHLIEDLKQEGVHITSDNKSAVQSSDLIILALKPYNIISVLKELASAIDPKQHILVSLATGITLSALKSAAPEPLSIFRAMPNTGADVSTSMTCICSSTQDNSANQMVHSCFESIGKTIDIDESLMDAATVLGACGIAFALRFIRGMIQGGIQIGFDVRTATAITNQTVKGAAELLLQKQKHPEYEIDKVTTPRGCTIAGLNEMEHNGFSSALIKGIVTSYREINHKPTS